MKSHLVVSIFMIASITIFIVAVIVAWISPPEQALAQDKRPLVERHAPGMINITEYTLYFQDSETLMVYIVCRTDEPGHLAYIPIPTDQIESIKHKIQGYKEPPFLTEYKNRIKGTIIKKSTEKSTKKDLTEKNLYGYFEE